MRFTTGKPDHDLTYDDVFMSPTRSSVRSRMEVDLTSTDALELPTPLIVANMTAISGRRMAETVARRGAVSIIPQDLSPSAATDAIARVKSAHTVFDTPIKVTPDMIVADALPLIPKRAHGVAVVLEGRRPVGLVSVSEASGVDVPVGGLDITMYRDDLRANPTRPVGHTDIPGPIDSKVLVLVDDVLYTGRTIRAALEALTDFGRPGKVELLVLVDRGLRELPIHADYVGLSVETTPSQRVDVLLRERDDRDEVLLVEA